MKRLKATVTLFVFCALFLPPVMATGALAAKQQASKSRTAKATKPAKKIVKPVVVPLPDRNPNRQAASTSAPAPASPDILAQAAPDMTGAVAEQPLPHEVPAAITTKAPPKGTGIPLPDRKPQSETKAAASPLVHMPDPSLLAPVPLATPVLPKPVSNSAYANVLKPLLDYQLTASDAANLKTAFGASYEGRRRRPCRGRAHPGQCRAQACHLVRISQRRLRCFRRGDRGFPPRQSAMAGPGRTSRARRDRSLSRRCRVRTG